MSYVKIALLLVFGMIFGLKASAQAELDLSAIRMPPGFSIEIWSDEVPNARSLALGKNGTVFVATRRDGRVYALLPVKTRSRPSLRSPGIW